VANAFIQPPLFAGADAAPRDDLALASAVLAASRQLGSALGVAALVGLLAALGGTSVGGFECAWAIVLLSAACTALAALFTGEQRSAGLASRPGAS
jgi:hypothetical protein